MVLKLYGRPVSTRCMRVTVVLKEKQIPYETIEVDFFGGEHKTPEFKKMNPLGQFPVIDDGGFILYESRAIGRYLCNKYASQGTPLVPTDTQALALFEQMASVETHPFLTTYHHHPPEGVETANFDISGTEVAWQKFYAPEFGFETDEEALKSNLEKFNSVLDIYESILSKQKYIAGDQLTLVDLFHLPVAHMIEKVGLLSLEDKPNVARWWKEISSRPSWQAVKY